jgi:hypothetical protein
MVYLLPFLSVFVGAGSAYLAKRHLPQATSDVKTIFAISGLLFVLSIFVDLFHFPINKELRFLWGTFLFSLSIAFLWFGLGAIGIYRVHYIFMSILIFIAVFTIYVLYISFSGCTAFGACP